MDKRTLFATLLTTSLIAALLSLIAGCAVDSEKVIDVHNNEIDVTLFRGAANNT